MKIMSLQFTLTSLSLLCQTRLGFTKIACVMCIPQSLAYNQEHTDTKGSFLFFGTQYI